MTPSPAPSRNNVAGIIALTGANACYVVNDTLVKLVGAGIYAFLRERRLAGGG